ncbi:glycosyltransferase family 4 protein [Flavobacterium urumqiense]|uniref:Glycosyltransferase involved in cell wall bisynthesis n=1 Tax=Flavobacterium urumqiense TaxID=935224 RepID=A0A1H6ASK4_9FLAO|nr:glycosyltransferase family 4 protein [Flavobacterium urumqiense]SEG51663.1 Glycosyltransferase involved in cell wall bisynthesis [Flavobacterium urumqiense]
MHIGFITSHFPFHDAKSVGGIGTSIKNLSDELVALGHDVSVFVYGQEKDDKFIEGGITLVTIKNIKIKGLSWFLTRKKIQKIILKEQKISRIDVVETPDWEGISSFINLHCPVVIRLNGSDTYFCHLDNRPVKWINKFHEKRALAKANGHISVSQYTADVTNQLFHINKKFTIIPNGINTNSFNSNDTCKDAKTILYFGGIIRKKGVLEIPHYFNQVIEKIPDAHLVIIGQDMSDKLTGNASTFQMMQQLFSEEDGLNVKFLGSVPYQEIKKYIEKATLCIFPSYAEALPVSWIEAMAMGKPVVASNIGWATEVIDDGIDGFLVDPSQHSEFADKIIQLLQNEELQKELGIEARKKIERKFSMSIVAQQSLLFYKSLIN